MTATRDNDNDAVPFKVGDRVTMRSALVDSRTGKSGRMLRGVVEPWGSGMIVRWDDWPCMTALPNPNVRRDEGGS